MFLPSYFKYVMAAISIVYSEIPLLRPPKMETSIKNLNCNV